MRKVKRPLPRNVLQGSGLIQYYIYALCALRSSAIKSANPPTIITASTMQDTGEVSPVTGALAFTVVFGAA